MLVVIFTPAILFGQHWTSALEISHGNQVLLPSYANAKCIAVESENIVHTVWMQDIGGNYEIFYARSIDYGTTWSAPQQLTETEPNSRCPAIAISGSGVHLVWVEETGPLYEGGKIYYKRSLDSGVSWEHDVLLDDEDDFQYPSITADELGNINVVWLHNDYLPKIKTKHSSNNGEDWDETLTIYTGGPPATNEILGKPSISAEGNGCPRVHIAVNRYREGQEEEGEGETGRTKILYARSADFGRRWETPYLIPNTSVTGPSTEPSIVAYESEVHIVYSYSLLLGNVPPRQAWVYWIYEISSLDGGVSWGERKTLYYSVTYVDQFFPLPSPTIGFDKAHLPHVTWSEWSFIDDIFGLYYTKSFSQGNIWETPIRFTTECSRPQRLSVNCYNGSTGQWNANNGIYLMWSEYDNGIYKIYFKRGWQIGENASYPNQGRHLARTVNTTNCYSVFQGENALFWQSRNSQEVNPPVGLCDGKYPSVAVSPAGLSWTCYTTEDANGRQHLKCQIRDDFSMEEIPLFDAESIFAPSLILATKIGDMGYVVYTIKNQGEYQIRFTAFDRDRVYYQTSLDHGNNDYPVCKPSISITPADFVHIVWQKFDNNTNRIFYITTLAPFSPDMIRNGYEPQWSDFDPVSTPDNPCTEPASNPFVEAYGGVVYVDWRGPYDEHNETGEIWQRWGKIRPGQLPDWNTPRNVSESPENESDYPVQSTSAFVAWQELENLDNWEIKLRYNTDDVVNISNTETPSQYPHINVMYTDEQAPHEYLIWTETNAPDIYELRFLDYQYIPQKDNLDEIVYYTVNTGDSIPSFYCEHRDGYIRYPNFPIDFGHSSLRYRLDYLNPAYYYKTKVIVYQNTTGRFRQTLTFDNIPVDSIEFPAGRPETVEIYIPKSTYRQDLQSVLRANRTQGNFSALTTFGLTQFEIIDSTGAGTGPQSANNTTVTLIPIDNFPNPFRTLTSVRYSLPIASRVSLAIYNASGRLVKTLINEPQSSGIYSVNWDGADNQKNRLPAGVYFYRLETDYSSQTKKVSIIR